MLAKNPRDTIMTRSVSPLQKYFEPELGEQAKEEFPRPAEQPNFYNS
jgi:hypothetical protein